MEILPIQLLSFDPSGRFMAYASGNDVLVLDLKSNLLVVSEDLNSQGHSDLVRTLSFDSEGKFMVTAGDDKKVKVWDTSNWKCVASRTHGKKISTVALGPLNSEGNECKVQVLYSDKFGDIYGGPANNLEKTDLSLGHCSSVCFMILSHDNKYLITCDRDEKIRVSNYPNTYDIESFCLGHTSLVSRLVIPHQASNYLVSGGSDGTIRLWDYIKGIQLQTVQVPPGSNSKCNVSSLSFSGKELTLAAVAEGHNSVLLYKLDVEKNELVHFQSLDFGGQLLGAQFGPDGSLYAHGRNPAISQCQRVGEKYANVSLSDSSLLSSVKEVSKEKLDEILKAVSLDSFRKLDNVEFQQKKQKWKEEKKEQQS
eukprot:TRINITY_DN6445_c0_g1_i1.p1 TRINITY_DN6445_c0_g1~~TRINITY_DN6445_c0_g1_i1.p1  ORF type:complete len:367 (-),score=130.58 TRINITY_DN6445_c0_g1_i1:87-1187(-)